MPYIYALITDESTLKIWKERTQDSNFLSKYSQYMDKLANNYWSTDVSYKIP